MQVIETCRPDLGKELLVKLGKDALANLHDLDVGMQIAVTELGAIVLALRVEVEVERIALLGADDVLVKGLGHRC